MAANEPVVEASDIGVPDFSSISAREKSELASVVFLVDFQQADDGKYIAIISDILKIEENTNFTHELGDEYQRASYFARDTATHSDGAVVMLVGKEAKLKAITNHRAGRIGAFGNITIEEFKELEVFQ